MISQGSSLRVLAVDSSTKFGTLALAELPAGSTRLRLLCEWSLGLDAQHSERLLWAIDQALVSTRLTLNQIDLFVVGVGPGSFTGLRIGISTMKSLSLALGKKLVGVSSLVAMARSSVAFPLQLQTKGVWIFCGVDACKGEIFTLSGSPQAIDQAISHVHSGNGEHWARGLIEEVSTPEAILSRVQKRIKTNASGWVLVVGDVWDRYPDLKKELKSFSQVVFLNDAQREPNGTKGAVLAQMGWEGLQAGLVTDPKLVRVRYLRASDAEVKLSRKHGADPK